MIVKENGHVYICGSIQMASDVKKMLRRVIQSWGKKSDSKVDEYIDKMKVSISPSLSITNINDHSKQLFYN